MLHLPSTEKYALAEPSTTVSGRTRETGSDIDSSGIKKPDQFGYNSKYNYVHGYQLRG